MRVRAAVEKEHRLWSGPENALMLRRRRRLMLVCLSSAANSASQKVCHLCEFCLHTDGWHRSHVMCVTSIR